jgi:hypothetical protein
VVSDKHVEVSVACTIAATLWVLSVVLMAVSWFWETDSLARLSLLICGAAVTATIRVYFIGLGRRMKAMLIVAATEGPGSVTSLR